MTAAAPSPPGRPTHDRRSGASDAAPGTVRVVCFGTYDDRRHPRVAVLREGLAAHGFAVDVVNVPLDLDTAARVQLVEQPWRAPLVAARLLAAWLRLLVRSRSVRRPDVVIVGYLGHFDVHLARLRWPRAHLVLDHMVSLADTVTDRGIDRSQGVSALLGRVDRAATRRADTVLVDTPEQVDLLHPDHRPKAVVVPVGAPGSWFATRHPDTAAPPGRIGDELAVVFFGLFTPLQGTPTIGRAIAALAGQPVRWTVIGTGQDRATCRQMARDVDTVRWIDWVDADDLPRLVAEHDVCLGIFGTGPKAQRVVPNKVFQGAAAGCAIITSDTPSQRRALDGAAVFVPPGDHEALSEAIMELSKDPATLDDSRQRARAVADERFRPAAVVGDLAERLRRPEEGDGRSRRAPTAPPLPPNAALRWHVVRPLVRRLAPARILELGVGQGAVGARLAAGAEYVGVEPDATSRAVAASRLPAGARLLADADDLPPDETFDLVCAFEVLEHIDDHEGALASWAARVRPGGHLLISVPADPGRYGPHDELVGHHRRYSTDDLSAVFTRAGLEIVTAEHYGFPLGAVLEAGRNAVARRRLRTGAAPDDVEARTARSGRHLQPPGWSGPAIWAATAPFRVVQRRFPRRGPGLVGLARLPA